ncbi:UNVERIFIED_CONTAM: hypothetical protein FKN15_066393 [Acipenser sinensis]
MRKGGSTCIETGRKWAAKKAVEDAKAALRIGDIMGQVQHGREGLGLSSAPPNGTRQPQLKFASAGDDGIVLLWNVQKTTVLFIGEEQPKNSYTELQVLKGHFDMVRFLVRIDDFRFASAGDDGIVLLWNVQVNATEWRNVLLRRFMAHDVFKEIFC